MRSSGQLSKPYFDSESERMGVLARKDPPDDAELLGRQVSVLLELCDRIFRIPAKYTIHKAQHKLGKVVHYANLAHVVGCSSEQNIKSGLCS
jgi:hypothetical protein